MPRVIELSPVAAARAAGLGIEAPWNNQHLFLFAGSLPHLSEGESSTAKSAGGREKEPTKK